MHKHAIILSSFVPAHNQSPAAVNQKMLRLCCATFDQVTFISANFPTEAVECLPKERFELINLPVDFTSANPLKVLLGYVQMQRLALPILKKRAVDRPMVLFWLSGPMLLPFLYCKLKSLATVGFLYGNSKLKAGKGNPFNHLKAGLMRFIAMQADVRCVEAPGVLRQWGYAPEDDRFKIVHLFADEHYREAIPPAQRQPMVGMCCRLVQNKCVLEGIEAFHLFRAKNPEYTLQIIGSGPLEAQCKARIAQLGEEDHIQLLGWVEAKNLPAYFNNWRLLLHPTKYEGLPNSVIESMCCSTPALSSPAGGVEDVIADGKTGWILQGNDPKQMERALTEIFSASTWSQVGEAAGAFARSAYSFEAARASVQSLQELFKVEVTQG